MSQEPPGDENREKPGTEINIEINVDENKGQLTGMKAELTGAVTVITPSASFQLPAEPAALLGGAIPNPSVERYVGRGELEEHVRRRLLGRETAAVVGLQAPGGTGKTELAIRLARALREQFEAVLWVELGERSKEQVIAELTRQCGLKLPPGLDYAGQVGEVKRALEQHSLLVVLDNVRQVHAEALRDFLPPSPPCAALLTSRVRQFAALPAQAFFELDALSPQQAGELLENELGKKAVQAEPQAAAELAERCRFNPLALNIAARRIRQTLHAPTPLGVFLEKLRRRQARLKFGAEPRLDLFAVFDESYAELDEADRRRFRRLAAFASTGFSPPGAAALWGDPLLAAEEALARLRNLSLLAPAAGRSERWRLHDLLDEYAAEKLGDAGETDAAYGAAAEYLLALFAAHETDDLSNAPEAGDELDNLRKSAAWAVERKDGALLARLATVPRNWYFNVFRIWEEWYAWLGAALAAGLSDQNLQANVLQAQGDVLQFRKEMDAGLAKYAAALGLFEAVGDRLGQANVLRAQGDVLRFRDDYDEALAKYAAALGLYEAVGDRLGQANVLRAQGDVLQFRDDYDEALAKYAAALGLYEALGARLGQANVFASKGQVFLIQGRQAEADALLAQAVAIYQAIGDRYSIAAQTGNYGWTLYNLGELERARPYLLRAVELFERIGLHDYAARHRAGAQPSGER